MDTEVFHMFWLFFCIYLIAAYTCVKYVQFQLLISFSNYLTDLASDLFVIRIMNIKK